MEVIRIKIEIDKNKRYIDIPELCPRCGVANNPTTKNFGEIVLFDDEVLLSFHHHCIRCDKDHFTIQKRNRTSDTYECLTFYPKYIDPEINELLLEHCPNFVKFYSESIEAENNNLLNVAGMGLRASIESLIKDYAVIFELDTVDDVRKTSFNNAINKYVKDDDLLAGALHAIRKMGNDFTHWYSIYEMPYNVLKTYVLIIINAFVSKFQMKFLPV